MVRRQMGAIDALDLQAKIDGRAEGKVTRRMQRMLGRVYECDGLGEANNAAECERYAREMGLRSNQYEVHAIKTPHTNSSQPYGLFVTEAAINKMRRKVAKAMEPDL